MEKSKLSRTKQKAGILQDLSGEGQEFEATKAGVLKIRRMTARRNSKKKN